MCVLKRAFLYVTRKRSKSILLFMIYLALTTLVMSAVAVGNASEKAATELRHTLGGYFKLENNAEYSGKQQAITDSMTDRIAGIEGIKASNRMNQEYLLMPGLTLEPGRFTAEGDEKAHLARFLGSTDSSLHEYFLLRSFELTEGRHIGPDDENKVLISKKFAQLNGLSLGDSISAEFYMDDEQANRMKKIYGWEVVGIFDINIALERNGMEAECDITDNFIFADLSSMMRVQTDQNAENAGKYRQVSFFADDPAQLATIIEHAYKLKNINWESLELNVNDMTYQKVVPPLERLRNDTNLFLLMIIGISVALLSLLLIMWMRERMHEIGIFLSAGIKKSSMIGQHIMEVLILLLFALAVAFPLARVISGYGGDLFLRNISREEVTVGKENEPSEMEPDAIISVSIDMDEFLFASAYGISVSLIAVGLSSILIMRLKPKDILSAVS